MKRRDSKTVFDRPARRPLKIYSSDPMAGRTVGNRIRIEIDNEPLRAGPQGSRIEVIDFDGASKRYYPPVDLDDPNVLMQGGIDPTESDPRFHQQMVYAVAMRTLENFDRALGRTVLLGRSSYPRLRLIPHAFYGANAFYDRSMNAILFGYFRADTADPGPNLPGQNVFTCLSHDIIAHEMTHAIVDRLRPYFLEPSNQDVLAFHEGFADIVALFQHFSFLDVLRDELQRKRLDIRERGILVDLARQFGYATGGGQALRSALDTPEKRLYETVLEPHERGSILVAAVFDAFFNIYQRRIRDLIRIATGGTGNLPQGDLHPDLVNRVATEAARTAQGMLTMCIRAFDYLPPVDITFGDYLRALVTADFELSPEDEYGQRAAVIDAFRMRGIYPEGVSSLAEESLLWDTAPEQGQPGALPPLNFQSLEMLKELLFAASLFSRDSAPWETFESAGSRVRNMAPRLVNDEGAETDVNSEMATSLHHYAMSNLVALNLRPDLTIGVQGFHPVFRVAPNGKLLVELVAQFIQVDRSAAGDFGGIPLRGGTTVVASADGRVRYTISKPLPSAELGASKLARAQARVKRQADYVQLSDSLDPMTPYFTADQHAQRMALRMSLASLHQGLHL